MSASCDESPTRAETDASTASWTVEDVGKKSKKLRKASKCVRKQSEQISQQNSPKEARDELHDPGGEADTPGDPESDPQGPRGGANDDCGDTNAPGRATGPGSVVHGPAWPKAWGFGPALRGFGLRKIQAGPYILALAWLQPGLA
jgi:hypothetical protein